MAKDTKNLDTLEALAVPIPEEPEYTVTEFAANARHLFGSKANTDIVYAAFLMAGISKTTLSTAKELVAGFMQKEVM